MTFPEFSSMQWIQAIVRYEKKRANLIVSSYEGSRSDFDRAVRNYDVDPVAKELIDHFVAITVEAVKKRLTK